MKRAIYRFLVILLAVSIVVIPVNIVTFAEEQELRTVLVMSEMYSGSTGLDASNRDQYPAYQEFLRQTHERGLDVQFDLVANEQYDVVLQTRFASGSDMPDIINARDYISDAAAIAYGQRGLVHDLYELYEKYDTDNSIMNHISKYFPELLGFITTEDGKMYWTSYCFGGRFIEDVPFIGSTYGLNLRKDWVEAIGKEWKLCLSTDELYEILVAFSEQDVNGSGVNDITVNINFTNFSNGIAQAFGIPNRLASFVSDRDVVQCPWYNENIEAYLRYMKSLVDAELYNTALIGTTTWQGLGPQMEAENRVSLFYDYISQTWHEPNVAGVEGVAYGPIFLDDGDGRFIMEREAVVMGYNSKTFVTSAARDLQAAVDLIDYVLTDINFTIVYNGGIQGQTFDFVQGPPSNEVKLEGINGVDFTYGNEDPTVTIKVYHKLNEIVENPTLKDISMWNFLYVLPPMGYNLSYMELKQNPTPYDYKNAGNQWILANYDDIVTFDTTQLLAMITVEELDTLNKYENLINTYSSELLIDLLLGNRDIDNLDTYIAEMRTLGLDEYLAVFTARNDRFKAAIANAS